MKRKGSLRYDATAEKRYRLGDLTSMGMRPPSDAGGSKILASIGAPFSTKGSGARLPDLNLQASTTGTFLLETTQTANVNGVTGGLLNLCSAAITYCEEDLNTGDATIGYCSAGPQPAPSTQNGRIGSNGQVVYTSTTWSASAASDGVTVQRNKLLPNFASVYGQASALRITGAAIQAEYTGNDQNNQGLITSYATCWSDIEQSSSLSGVPNNVATPTQPFIQSNQGFAENFRTQYNGAAKHGVNVSWLPVDNGDLEYGIVPNPGSSATASLLTVQGATYLPLVNLPTTREWGLGVTNAGLQRERSARNYGALIWHANGLAAGATFRVSVIVHVEMLPINDTPSLGADMAICRPLNSVMSTIAGLASGPTTGSTAETEGLTEARGAFYETAATVARTATNDDTVSTITDIMENVGMADQAAALRQAMAMLKGLGRFIDAGVNLSPVGGLYAYLYKQPMSNFSGDWSREKTKRR